MSTNCTRRNRYPPSISPDVAADPLRKAIHSPTAVHEFADDDASDATETCSDCSSLDQYLSRIDATEISTAPRDHAKNNREEEAAYRDYFTRMSRLAENARVAAADGSVVPEEADALDLNAPVVEAAADGIQLGQRYTEDASKCCELSGKCCGMTEEVHGMLFHSAKWFCHRLGARPIGHVKKLDEESAAIRIQSKWRSFVAAKHYAATITSVLVFVDWHPSREADEEESASCAAVIQSRWKTYAASRRYARMIAAVRVIQSFLRRELAAKRLRQIHQDEDTQECIGDILLQDLEDRAAILCQSIVRRMLVRKKIQKARRFHLQPHQLAAAESAAIQCQSAIRRWIAVRRVEKMRTATARRYPNQKHVARTGHIELILHGTNGTPDETFTAYSEPSDTSWEEEEEEEEEEEQEEEDEGSYCPSKTDDSERQYEHSRCGLSENVHEMLIQSGKWIYDRVGDPGIDTAHDLLTIMEISEDVVFCCGGKPSH
ncbi:hypothetical protein ACHAWX_000866 [Stephanocyclus meneghinianus]